LSITPFIVYPERWRSAARDYRRTTPFDFIASPPHCVVRPSWAITQRFANPAFPRHTEQ
jgi:hypothetical protein